MKFKLDENFPRRGLSLFLAEGHDAHTVREESLGGADDDRLYRACCAEQRCLVSLDLDFSDPVRFQPAACGGIIIFRLPVHARMDLWVQMMFGMLAHLRLNPIQGNLWIVEPGRIRVHLR